MPLNFVVVFEDTAHEIDFRLEASLQAAVKATPALVVAVVGVVAAAARATAPAAWR